ncbi:MAG: hypothetical protein IT443_04895 [Phycisphaeraceae bacterium]|nr:hypothetical protein [Phycisphaeraceae bacterium]
MLERCKQVLLTYVTRPLMWWMLIPTVLAYIGLVVLLSHDNKMLLQFAFLPFVIMQLLLGLLAQLNSQFANPRSRLLPGFAGPHVLIAGLIVVLCYIAFPATFALACQASVLTVTSLFFATTIAMLWLAVVMPSGVWIFVLAGSIGFSIPMIHSHHQWFKAWPDGLPYAWAIPLWLTSILAGWALAKHLAGWREDSRGFRGLMRWKTGGATGFTQKQYLAESSWQRWFMGRPGEAVFRPAKNAWQRINRWRFTKLGLLSPRAMGLVCFVLMTMLMGLDGRRGGPSDSHGFNPFLFTYWAWMVSLSCYVQRYRVLATESLRPIYRRAYFRQIGLAMLCDVMSVWLSLAAAMIAATALWQPALLQTGNFWFALLLSGFCQISLWGISCWPMAMLRLRWRDVWLGLAFVIVFMSPIVLKEFISVSALAYLSGVQALLGVGIAGVAYRKWLRTDLAFSPRG